MSEEWRPIKGYEGLYEVSNLGRVRSLGRYFQQRHYSGIMARHYQEPQIMRPHYRPNGYVAVGLCDKNGIQKGYSIHRLVAEAFLEKVDGKSFVNHKDSDRANNNAENLEWCTQSENVLHAYRFGNMTPPHMRKIDQLDLLGKYIKTWMSQAEIERNLNIRQTNVSKVCRGLRNQAGGYKWRYTE